MILTIVGNVPTLKGTMMHEEDMNRLYDELKIADKQMEEDAKKRHCVLLRRLDYIIIVLLAAVVVVFVVAGTGN